MTKMSFEFIINVINTVIRNLPMEGYEKNYTEMFKTSLCNYDVIPISKGYYGRKVDIERLCESLNVNFNHPRWDCCPTLDDKEEEILIKHIISAFREAEIICKFRCEKQRDFIKRHWINDPKWAKAHKNLGEYIPLNKVLEELGLS